MERQDSSSSMGSSASGISGMSAASSQAAGDGLAGSGPGDIMDQSQTILSAVFGTLLTLFRERWEDSKRYLAARAIMEHLQLLLILLQAHFLWTFDYSHWLWKVCNYFLLKVLVVPMGYVAYNSILYVIVVFIGISLAASGWISYTFVRNGIVPNKWPVKLLRFSVMLFYQVFYITILNYLLAPLNCNWLAATADGKYYNADFPTYQCNAMPHLAQMAVAGSFSLLYIAMGGLFALADVTPNPVSQHWLATAHSTVEVKTWVFRTVIVLCANLLSGFWKVQAVPILIAAGWMAYVHVRWQPYYFQWINHLRTGLYAMTAYVALMLTINVWAQQNAAGSGLSAAALLELRAKQVTLLTFALMPAALVAGFVISWTRLHLTKRAALKKFRGLGLSDPSSFQGLKDVHKFVDAYEVELIARCCRRWEDYEDGILDTQAVKLAELVIKAGLPRFPHSAHMTLVYVNFLGSVLDSQQSCNSQLQVAKKLEPNWCDRYVIFVREQQQMALLQQQTSSGTESAVDLVGYVEFQRNYRQVLRVHKSALYAQRAFWKVLLHSNVSFNSLVHAFRHIETCRTRADKSYKTVLERYPTNVKVLRAYARFLEDVKNDPWSASKYYSEADRMEEQEGVEGAEALAITEDGDAEDSNMLRQVDEKNNAVCVINAQGTIQMANKVLLKMFGYRKGELEGKNVSMLMPQPFSGRHNSYLRNYQTTGKAKIMDSVQEVVALHKEHYVFPISLAVTKVSGIGADAVFMGVIKPSAEDPNAVKAWVMPGGLMLCVDARFTDWFGKVPADCVGRPFSTLGVEADKLSGLMDMAMNSRKEDFDVGRVFLKDVALTHKYADPQRVDITVEMSGSESQRLYVAVIRKCCASESEHLMVTDHKGRITYITSKLAGLLGSTPKGLVKTEFSRFLAQPFMQLHNKWMKDMPVKVPLSSCRSGTPVVLVSQQRAAIPAKLEISSRELGEETIYIVKVTTTTFPLALDDRRLSLSIDSAGTILEVNNTPAHVFGFKPAVLVGRNISECIDVFTGLPESGGPQGLDLEHVLTALVHKVLEHKDTSWRCGVHLPMTAAELAAAQSNVIQANMLANQTKAALLQLEVQEADDEHGGVVSITMHLWRSEMLTGVVEVDKEGNITKAGCCPLHQPGALFGVPSSALQRTPLSRWLNVPSTYEGLLMDSKKKGALKRKVADVKIGPLRHASGRHFDGDSVHIAVQAVVKEGTGPERLVVKLTVEKPRKGNPNFARHILGLVKMPAAASGVDMAGQTGAAGQRKSTEDADDAGAGNKSIRARGGVKFGGNMAGSAAGSDEAAEEEGRASDDDAPARPAGGKSERLMEWVRQASGVTAATAAAEDQLEPEESMATTAYDGGMPPPPDEAGNQDGYVAPPETNLVGDEAGSVASGGDAASSQVDGSEAGGYHSDFKRGRRLRKLARMLNSKQAQKASARFYKHTVLIIAGLLIAHIACFIASVVLIEGQKQYIEEVDDAGRAVISMHRMAIDCRVLDALHRGIEQPGIFTQAELGHYVELFEDAISQFQDDHEKTYLGRTKLRRFFNRHKYKLQDYWEQPMWNATELIDTSPPRTSIRQMGLWEMGNEIVAAAREVQSNHERLTANGTHLSDTRFWYFVMENAPWSLYNGYKLTLYGLVERVLAKIGEVSTAMIILMVLEGFVVFMAASVYVCLLIKQMVMQRANLFSVFLVIPTGFLRALASKQVQLDEDGDSDDDSEAGDMQAQQDPQQQQEEVQKLNLSLPSGKKVKGQQADGPGGGDYFSRKHKVPRTVLGRLAHSLNPLTWFSSQMGHMETGKKQLVRNSRDTAIVTGPFMFWGLIIIMIYAISIVQLGKVQGPFQMLNMINFLVFRVTRGVLFALETCMAPNNTMIDIRKTQTAQRLHDLQRDYISFLYGFPALGEGAVRDDMSTDDAAVFQNEALANIFFRETDCMRGDHSTCFQPGHKFYDVTHNGLDAMATRFIQETTLLLADKDADINITNPRLEYLWQIGRFDLFEGMRRADETFSAFVESLFDQLKTAHIVVFVFSMLGALVLWLGMVRPYLKAAGKETRQIAEMLSQLPPEMDVEGLISQALAGDDMDEERPGNNRGSLEAPSSGFGGKLNGFGGIRGSADVSAIQRAQDEAAAAGGGRAGYGGMMSVGRQASKGDSEGDYY